MIGFDVLCARSAARIVLACAGLNVAATMPRPCIALTSRSMDCAASLAARDKGDLLPC